MTRRVGTKDYPAGPYADSALLTWEHPEIDWRNYFDVEHKDCAHEWANRLAWDAGQRRPMPNMRPQEWQFFGFMDVWAMREWFLGEFGNLRRYGFVASVFEVPDNHIHPDNRQVLFTYDHARKIGSTTPLSYKRIESWLNG